MGSYGYRSVNCVQCEVEGKCALGANGAATLTDCDSAGGPICDACLRLWLTPSKVSKAEGGSATLSEPVAEVAAPRVEASVTRNTSGISVFFCGRPFSVDWQCLLRYMFEQWRQVSHERIRRADSFRFFSSEGDMPLVVANRPRLGTRGEHGSAAFRIRSSLACAASRVRPRLQQPGYLAYAASGAATAGARDAADATDTTAAVAAARASMTQRGLLLPPLLWPRRKLSREKPLSKLRPLRRAIVSWPCSSYLHLKRHLHLQNLQSASSSSTRRWWRSSPRVSLESNYSLVTDTIRGFEWSRSLGEEAQRKQLRHEDSCIFPDASLPLCVLSEDDSFEER